MASHARRISLAAAIAVVAGSLLAPQGANAVPAPLEGAAGTPAIAVFPRPGVDLTALPLRDTRVTLTGPKAGWTWACTPGNPNAPGAIKDGSWIQGDTWNLLDKVAVRGAISWKASAKYTEQAALTKRTITTMRVPTAGTTGEFPIAQDDPASEYDKNPGRINPSQKVVTVPRSPARATAPSCLPMGAIGVAKNGVMLYNALDARNQDARAHEIQDSCEGHPNMYEYHYHAGSACVIDGNRDSGPNSTVLFGYAFDGFGIYVERDGSGEMLKNSDLDACHGRTSRIKWNGKTRKMYHYVVTEEFPYLLGCFAGTDAVPSDAMPPR